MFNIWYIVNSILLVLYYTTYNGITTIFISSLKGLEDGHIGVSCKYHLYYFVSSRLNAPMMLTYFIASFIAVMQNDNNNDIPVLSISWPDGRKGYS